MKIFNIEIGKKKVRDEYSRNNGGFVSRWARPPSLNTTEWLNMFSKSPRLAVVERIANDLAGVSGKLLRVNKDGSEIEVLNHPFLDFMSRPNPLYEMTSSAMWRLHEIYLLLVGESFFLIERDETGRPVELWNVPPNWVRMTPYLGSPYYSIISADGQSMRVPVDDIFVMKQLNPLDPFMRGLGSAESIADEVEIDEYAAKFQKRFFYNDATPPVVFLMPDATPEQRDTFMARWNQKHRGVENSHLAAALTGNVDVKELGSTDGKNLGFIESREAMRDAVLEHFGVPREIMGITENSNRATADAAQYIYAKNVLMPKLTSREEAINKQLLPLFGENLVWRYDPIIPYDRDFDKSKALEAYSAGLITRNEARELMDMPDVEGGDVYKISINDLFLNENDNPVEISEALYQESAVLPTGEQKACRVNISLALKREELAARKQQLFFETAITRHFKEQYHKVESALGLTEKAESDVFNPLVEYLRDDGTFDSTWWATLPETDQLRFTEAIANGLLNWNEEVQNLLQLFMPLWKQAYDAGVELNTETYGLQALQRPEFIAAAKINGGKRVVGIEEVTKRKIADVIAKGIANGSSQIELKKEILSEMTTTRARAKIIARQETATALATGQFDIMRKAGATAKTWHHRPQKDPRDGTNGKVDHVTMEGETVGIDERFSNGLRFPRDPEDNRPEQLINCRCYLTFDGF